VRAVLSIILIVVGLVLLAVSFVPALRSLGGGTANRLAPGQAITFVIGLVCLIGGFVIGS
jgi:hypothetical protein